MVMVTRRAVSFEERVGQVLLEGGFITNQQLAEARVARSEERRVGKECRL